MAVREEAGHSHCYDAIVVGAGIQGSFAAYCLAQRHQKTVLLEQFPLPHTRGSSHGQSRIIRSAYPEDYYTVMMGEAYRLWAELEAKTGTKLYRQTPILILGRQENPMFQSFQRTMERYHIPGATYTPQDLAQKFPGFCPFGGEMAVSDLSAGILYASKALQAVQDQFRHSGGTVRDGEKVLSILPGDSVTVITSQGKYQAKRLVIAAGPWTSHLLAPLGLHLPLQPLRITVCYWKAKDHNQDHGAALEQLPCFLGIQLSGEGHDIYGLPVDEYPGLVKICYHHGFPTDPDKPDQLNQDSDVHILKDFVSKYLPGLDPKPAVQERCIYTNTPDEDFVLDQHPHFRNIIIGAGFSGHGFKFAPVIGKILCELSLGEKPIYNLAPFQISRFSNLPKAVM